MWALDCKDDARASYARPRVAAAPPLHAYLPLVVLDARDGRDHRVVVEPLHAQIRDGGVEPRRPSSAIALRIYDVGGRLVKTLVEGPQPAGEESVTWNGRDDAGRPVASGVYFYRLTAPNYTKTHKRVLME